VVGSPNEGFRVSQLGFDFDKGSRLYYSTCNASMGLVIQNV
jgi:hypothetical protein